MGILADQCLCVGGLLRFRQPRKCHTAIRKDVVQASHAAIRVAGRNRDLTDVLAHKGHFTGKAVHDGTKGSTSLRSLDTTVCHQTDGFCGILCREPKRTGDRQHST